MFAKLFELVCFHIVKAAERGGWQPKAPQCPRPVVRLIAYGNGCASAVDDRGTVVGGWSCSVGEGSSQWSAFADRPLARRKCLYDISSEQAARKFVIDELSTWAEVDTGEK